MSYFIPLFIVAIVFWYIGKCDYKGYLKLQKNVIKDYDMREKSNDNRILRLRAMVIDSHKEAKELRLKLGEN